MASHCYVLNSSEILCRSFLENGFLKFILSGKCSWSFDRFCSSKVSKTMGLLVASTASGCQFGWAEMSWQVCSSVILFQMMDKTELSEMWKHEILFSNSTLLYTFPQLFPWPVSCIPLSSVNVNSIHIAHFQQIQLHKVLCMVNIYLYSLMFSNKP